MTRHTPAAAGLAALLALPACVTPTGDAGGGCGAAGYRDLVGRDRSVA
ncbi:hypothetical protein [Roseicyclus salinarum]|nr:hypothetical protein [Roseibacterium sp. SDUM158017]